MRKLFTKLKQLFQMFFLFVRVVFTLRVGRSTSTDDQDNVGGKEDTK